MHAFSTTHPGSSPTFVQSTKVAASGRNYVADVQAQPCTSFANEKAAKECIIQISVNDNVRLFIGRDHPNLGWPSSQIPMDHFHDCENAWTE